MGSHLPMNSTFSVVTKSCPFILFVRNLWLHTSKSLHIQMQRQMISGLPLKRGLVNLLEL
jgi:hypothetical protein